MEQFDQMDRRRDETQVPIIKLEEKKTKITILDLKYTQIKWKGFSLKLTVSLLTSSESLK